MKKSRPRTGDEASEQTCARQSKAASVNAKMTHCRPRVSHGQSATA
jgi:hypothetical protein